MIRRYPQIAQMNIEVTAVFHSTAEEINAYAGKQRAPFPVIADSELDLHQLFVSRRSFKGKMRTMINLPKMMKMMSIGLFNFKSTSVMDSLPADFFIDENLRVQLAY